jgi:hypothetical protein
LEELTALYLDWAEKDLVSLEAAVASARQDPQCWPAVREEVRRIVHNVKGQGTSFGYPLVTQVGNSLSMLLKVTDEPDPMTLKLVAAHIQALRLVLTRDVKGDGGEEGVALVENLTALVKDYSRS